MNKCGRIRNIVKYSEDNSSELPDLHTKQPPVSEVHALVRPACLHKLLPRGHQRGNWRKPWMKDVSNSICPTNTIQVSTYMDIF